MLCYTTFETLHHPTSRVMTRKEAKSKTVKYVAITLFYQSAFLQCCYFSCSRLVKKWNSLKQSYTSSCHCQGYQWYDLVTNCYISIADSMKVALGVGNYALRSFCLVVTQAKHHSEYRVPRLNAQCLIAKSTFIEIRQKYYYPKVFKALNETLPMKIHCVP